MVTRYAVVCDGMVDNVVLWDGKSDWTPPEGCDLVRLDEHQAVSPGDAYDGSTFTRVDQVPVTEVVAVTVDPQALTDLLTQAQKATTVTATRNVLTELLQQLQPDV